MFGNPKNVVDGDATSQPKRKLHPFRWISFVLLVLCGLVFIPSAASLVFLLAALLICPIRRFRELDFIQRVEAMAAVSRMNTNFVINVIATALFFIGVLVSPSQTETTRSAPKADSAGLITVTGDIEYSSDPVAIFDYVTCSDEGAKLEAEDDVVANKVGTQVVTFKISRGFLRSSRENVELTVRDTQAPTVELAKDSVEIMAGDKYDPTSNVKAVADPVDGDLAAVQEEPKAKKGEVGLDRLYDEGWYLVSPADTSKVGEQEITVTAVDQHGNRATASFMLKVGDPFEDTTFKQTTTDLEYSNKQVDPAKLVECSDPEVKITADKISLDKVGDIKVVYTYSKGDASKKETLTFHVRDTKEPRIALGEDELSIEKGESFDPYGNVASVEDEVDGPLARVDEEPKENGDGWYTIQGSYDVDVPSKYYLTVVACDRNGNRVTKEFSLLVKDPPAQETGSSDQDSAAPTHDYIVNTNTGKFHYPSCSDVKRMKDSNKWQVTTTHDELVSEGYSPCGHCNP
jgi:hypothetical protein